MGIIWDIKNGMKLNKIITLELIKGILVLPLGNCFPIFYNQENNFFIHFISVSNNGMFRIWRSDKDNLIYVKELTKINMKKIKNYEFPVILMLMVMFLLSDNQSLLIGTKKSFLLFYRYNIEKKKIITYREIAG